ncbi:NADH-quinone oxidoreductase subunit I [Serinicoccus sp. CNJ-927]|uniref:NADH-quinone oxidoreductase subunit A n=1 Tax=Serinicoccus marinus TaxID=247333 RepID=UPI0003B3FE03|nr:NADH-quinone oxidoreductase subunit A [Serinicoccus marinus]OLT40129.1 NADH-quinone oxidoreductase subunit I [Serinicoccus sp. CNJ-927]
MYLGLIGVAISCLVALAGMFALHRATAVAADPLHTLPFESGWVPQQHALSRYHVRWYLASLVFLAFDVEMLFMYPWAVVVAQVGWSAVVEMFLFLGALLVAVVWAWREGAFRWV